MRPVPWKIRQRDVPRTRENPITDTGHRDGPLPKPDDCRDRANDRDERQLESKEETRVQSGVQLSISRRSVVIEREPLAQDYRTPHGS